jgi:hypothetical protein
MQNLFILFFLLLISACGGSADGSGSNDPNNPNQNEGAPPPGESFDALTADWSCKGTFNHEICNGVETIYGLDDSEMEAENFVTTVFDSKGCSVDLIDGANDANI